MRLIAGNLYTVHIQGSYVLDCLLVFLNHHIFGSYVRVTLGAVSFSYALVSILQFQHLVPLQAVPYSSGLYAVCLCDGRFALVCGGVVSDS